MIMRSVELKHLRKQSVMKANQSIYFKQLQTRNFASWKEKKFSWDSDEKDRTRNSHSVLSKIYMSSECDIVK